MGRVVRRARCFECSNHGAGKEHLPIVNLALGEIVARDLREAGQRGHIEQLAEFCDLSRPEAECGQVVLIDAGMDRLLLSLNLFEAQVVFEAHGDGFVQRKPEDSVAGWMGGDAAEERIGGRSGVGHLRGGSRGNQKEDRQKGRGRCREKDRISRLIH